MNKFKSVAIVIALSMLLPMFTSCSQGANGKTVVKADDPWYESTKFKLERDLQEFDRLLTTDVCISNDNIFSVYCPSSSYAVPCRTIIDTYDLEGKMVNRQEITIPDDFNVMTLHSASVDPEGKSIKAIIYMFNSKEYGDYFVDIDIASGQVTGINKLFDKEANKVRKSESGIYMISNVEEYTIVVLHYSLGSSMNFQVLLYKDSEFVTELDTSTVEIMQMLDGFSINRETNSLYLSAFLQMDIVSLEFDLSTGKLKGQTSVEDADENTVNMVDYTSTDDGVLCKLDSLGNIMTIDPDTMTPKTLIDTNWYTPYFYPSNTNGQMAYSKILRCSEDRAVIMDTVSTQYGSDYTIQNDYIRVLYKAEKNPHAGKKVIELALPLSKGVSNYLANSIYQFNKTDDEYIIRVWDRYKTGFSVRTGAYSKGDENEQQIYKMIQDLKGSDAPDLAISIQKNYAMYDNIFMDLTDFLDTEVAEKQFTNVFDACKIGGKQYFLPICLEIDGFVINEKLVKDGAVGITFEDYDKLVKEEMDGYSPYDYPESDYCNKRHFIFSCIDTKSAIEGETVDFGTEQFRAAVEYAKNNFEYDTWQDIPSEYLYDWNRYRGECYYAEMDDFLDYVYACHLHKEHYKIIGTPSVDASGPRFRALETISVSASTDVKDGAKKFLNYLFSGSAFASDECAFRQIVTNKDIVSKNLETLSTINNKGYEIYRNSVRSGAIIPAPNYDKVYGDKEATEDMRNIFIDNLSTISTYIYDDSEIIKFVEEEVAPYFKGDYTIDDTIKYLNDRAGKYVKEK